MMQFALFSGVAQSFVNGELEGPVNALSDLPPAWEKVPHTDPNCLATSNGSDTPDLTGPNGPVVGSGIFGHPQEGNSFVSGLYSIFSFNPFSTNCWHEGIQQRVEGFIPGCSYDIIFYQAVVKQNNAQNLDSTGSWAVYIDDVLAGVSSPSTGHQDFDDPNLNWEFRRISFLASLEYHTIKFLPADDDSDQWNNNPYGGLRMGIDAIYLDKHSRHEDLLGPDTTFCFETSHTLDVSGQTGIYEWQNQSNSAQLSVQSNGLYWINITNLCERITDSVYIAFDSVPQLELGPDSVLCRGDTLVIDEFHPAMNYSWNNGSTNNTIIVEFGGFYELEMENACGSTSDQIYLNVANCDCEVYLPNAFSPNDDALNPGFMFFSECAFEEFSLQVFDRWGKLMFHTEDPLEYWDGSFDGEKCPEGSYTYFLTYRLRNSPPFKRSGPLHLFR